MYEPSRALRAAFEHTGENLNMAAQYASWVYAGDVEDVDDTRAARRGGAPRPQEDRGLSRQPGVAHYRARGPPASQTT